MKKILMTALIMSLAIVAFAQRGPGQRGIGPGGPPPAGGAQTGQRPDPTTALKNALGLTDAQVTAIQALITTRQDRAKTIMADVQAKQQALGTLLNATPQDPTAIGNAMIALRASEKQMAAERDWFISELKKLLTADQQATLDKLIAAGTPLPGLGGPGFGGPRGGRGLRPGGI